MRGFFYRPLPNDRAVGVQDLLRHATKNLTGDLARFVITGCIGGILTIMPGCTNRRLGGPGAPPESRWPTGAACRGIGRAGGGRNLADDATGHCADAPRRPRCSPAWCGRLGPSAGAAVEFFQGLYGRRPRGARGGIPDPARSGIGSGWRRNPIGDLSDTGVCHHFRV